MTSHHTDPHVDPAADPAVDVDAVTAWFGTEVPGARPPLAFHRIPGGNSNITLRVVDADGQRYVLRRPPISEVLSTAHDMSREHRIVTALAGSGVPVPPVLALCEDPEVNGAPFYVMSFVDGQVLSSPEEVEEHLEPAVRQRAADALVDVLADLHALVPAEVGLGELGRTHGYVERQLRRWSRQLEQIESPRRARLQQVHDALAAAVPEQRGVSIVHGDYRLGNCLVGDDGRINAVLDWELCTLGDPLADVGYLLLDWDSADTSHPVTDGSPTRAAGFPRREHAAERYAARSGRDLGDLGFYVAFSAWRKACIVEGVYSRYVAGAVGEIPDNVEEFPPRVTRYLEAAGDALTG